MLYSRFLKFSFQLQVLLFEVGQTTLVLVDFLSENLIQSIDLRFIWT